MAWQCVYLSAFSPSETHYSVVKDDDGGQEWQEAVTYNELDGFACRASRGLSDEVTPIHGAEVSFRNIKGSVPVEPQEAAKVEFLFPVVGFNIAKRFADYFDNSVLRKYYYLDNSGLPISVAVGAENSVGERLVRVFADWRHDGRSSGEPADDLRSAYIYDVGGDGTVDNVSGETASGNSSIYIGARSSYTEGMLQFFDPILERRELGHYSYENEKRQPDRLYVRKGAEVKIGDPLFAYDTANGPVTYFAEGQGVVDNCTHAKFCMTVVKKADEPSFHPQPFIWYGPVTISWPSHNLTLTVEWMK